VKDAIRQILRLLIPFLFSATTLVVFAGCTSNTTPEQNSVAITNNSTSVVTIYYAQEDDNQQVAQKNISLTPGSTGSIQIQLSTFGDGPLSAKNSIGKYRTYDVSNNNGIISPVFITDGDFL